MSLSLRVLKEEFQVYFVFAEFQQFTFLSCLCTSTLPLPLSQLPLLTDESNDLQDKEGKLMFMFAQKGEMHFLSTDITKNKKHLGRERESCVQQHSKLLKVSK